MVSEKFSLFHFISVSAPTENEKRIKETEKATQAKYGKEFLMCWYEGKKAHSLTSEHPFDGCMKA